MVKYNRPRYTRKSRKSTRRQRIKKWAGEKPSAVERIAKRYVGPMGTIASTVGSIMRMINPEKKYIDNTISLTSVPNTGITVATYTMMAQGLGDQARNGNTVKGVDVSGKMYLQKNIGVQTTAMRLLWVLDKECDGSIPSLSQILDNVDIVSGVNKDYSKRFVILKDKMLTLNDGGGQTKFQKYYFPTDFHIHYDGTSSAITDAKENQIFLFAISDQTSDFAPIITHFGRFNFYDN